MYFPTKQTKHFPHKQGPPSESQSGGPTANNPQDPKNTLLASQCQTPKSSPGGPLAEPCVTRATQYQAGGLNVAAGGAALQKRCSA